MSAGQQLVELDTGDRVSYSVHEREVKHPRLTFNPDGTLAVVVPDNTPTREIVTQNREWIASRYEDQLESIATVTEKYGDLTDGFTLWGTPYEIREADTESEIRIEEDHIVLSFESGRSAWSLLRSRTKEALRQATYTLAEDYVTSCDAEFSTIAIRDQRTKWASCSGGDTLNFNIRCAFLPLQHLRYLVAHEVAHLRHSDHTEQFWQTVKSLVPDYETLRSELQGFWYAVHRNKNWQSILDC